MARRRHPVGEWSAANPPFQRTRSREPEGGRKGEGTPRSMPVTCAHETDPTCQALLETYVAVATGVRSNDLDMH